jgi:hypothetical protein
LKAKNEEARRRMRKQKEIKRSLESLYLCLKAKNEEARRRRRK